jgi:hypothetical protein
MNEHYFNQNSRANDYPSFAMPGEARQADNHAVMLPLPAPVDAAPLEVWPCDEDVDQQLPINMERRPQAEADFGTPPRHAEASPSTPPNGFGNRRCINSPRPATPKEHVKRRLRRSEKWWADKVQKLHSQREPTRTPRKLRREWKEKGFKDRSTIRDSFINDFCTRYALIRKYAGGTYVKVKIWAKKCWASDFQGIRSKWWRWMNNSRRAPFDMPILDEEEFWEWTGERSFLMPYDAEYARQAMAALEKDECANEFDESAKLRNHGFMLTYNGRWGSHRVEVQELIEAKVSWYAQAKVVQTSPWFKALFAEFAVFAKELAMKCKWPKWSCKMELSLNRKTPHNFVHFHLCVTDYGRRHRSRAPEFYKWKGTQPMLVPCNGKGRSLNRCLDALHYYCQAPKIGAVMVATNYTIFSECPVEIVSIFQLWKRYKMETETAKIQMKMSRSRNTKNFVMEMDYHVNWRKQCRDHSEQEVIKILMKLKPFRIIPEVIEWVTMFVHGHGKRTRFPFLVMDGPSLHGKTRFAAALFGVANTLILSCQGVAQPHMKHFERGRHKAIVFDEAHHRMVVSNKQLFQAGLDEVTLSQSNCQEHAYAVWMYGVPLIVSTNEWLMGAEPHEVAWLNSNSVVIKIDKHLWVEDMQAIMC